jgi:DNA-directed RNA polymerase specialized sigma subunit
MDSLALNQCAIRMKELQNSGLSDRRREAEENKLIVQIYSAMRNAVCLMVNKKGMSSFLEDAEQQARIAIYRACFTFDPEMASFNTYAHWQIRAELKALELTMIPERRKIKLKQKFSMFSLSMPIITPDGKEGDSAQSFLIDETSENLVEERAMVHIALSSMDRLFSQYIGKKYRAFCKNNVEQDARERRVLKLMRNRDVFYRNRILMQKFDDIAVMYGVSRERIRQIIKVIDRDLKGYFPVVVKETKDILPPTRIVANFMDESWKEVCEIYGQYTDEEACLVKRYHLAMSAPMEKPELLEIIRKTGGFMVEETESFEQEKVDSIDFEEIDRELNEISCSIKSQATKEYLFDDDEIPVINKSSGNKMQKIIAGAVIAGTMAIASPVTAQHSRGIPPSDTIILAPHEMPQKPKPEVTIQKSVVTPVKGKYTIPEKPEGAVWVARVAEYNTAAEVSQNKEKIKSKYSELKDLKPAIIPAKSGKKPGLGFGPLTMQKASELCTKLKNKGVSCILVRLRP